MNNEIIESIINNDGLTLAGEAAQQYVTYKYVTYFTDMAATGFWIIGVLCAIGWVLKKYHEDMDK